MKKKKKRNKLKSKVKSPVDLCKENCRSVHCQQSPCDSWLNQCYDCCDKSGGQEDCY